ncbi:MAG: hypothetical protein HPY66_2710 [Firmicutes bacterium]|nr:hypothetical protein [Bacillota bacterium]
MAKNDGEFYTFRGYQLLKQNKKNLTASMEDYMEMIYRQCKEEGYVRINSLARAAECKRAVSIQERSEAGQAWPHKL